MRGVCVWTIATDTAFGERVSLFYRSSGADVVMTRYAHDIVFPAVQPDLAVLAGGDAWQVESALRQIRGASGIPVVVIVAEATGAEKIRAFQAGADEHVVEPVDPQELVARSHALLRRQSASRDAFQHYEDRHVEVDFRAAEAKLNGSELSLTRREYALLCAFVRNSDTTLTTEELLALAWGDRTLSTARVKLTVGYLRRKMRAAGCGVTLIETVRGLGYRYRPLA